MNVYLNTINYEETSINMNVYLNLINLNSINYDVSSTKMEASRKEKRTIKWTIKVVLLYLIKSY